MLTGEYIEFSILFAIPVALAAWSLKPYQAYGLSVALPLLRLGFVLFYWEGSRLPHVLVWNVIINIVALIGYAYLITKISLRKRSLEAKVKRLEEKLSGRYQQWFGLMNGHDLQFERQHPTKGYNL